VSRRFKAKKIWSEYIPSRLNRTQSEIRRLALRITNESQLAAIMAQVKPEMREQGLEQIKPYLRFPVSSGFSIPEVRTLDTEG
jgi:hypothetical protein